MNSLKASFIIKLTHIDNLILQIVHDIQDIALYYNGES